ncbi:MAG: hypothetical protein ISS56_06955 [Anaerolineae bacterium]|nr:hypothetical protein [Anaerolineae bacterium]
MPAGVVECGTPVGNSGDLRSAEEAAGLRPAVRADRFPVYQADRKQTTALVRAELGRTVFASAWAEGWTMRPEQAVDYALGAAE